jgi:hypothetical protein
VRGRPRRLFDAKDPCADSADQKERFGGHRVLSHGAAQGTLRLDCFSFCDISSDLCRSLSGPSSLCSSGGTSIRPSLEQSCRQLVKALGESSSFNRGRGGRRFCLGCDHVHSVKIQRCAPDANQRTTRQYDYMASFQGLCPLPSFPCSCLNLKKKSANSIVSADSELSIISPLCVAWHSEIGNIFCRAGYRIGGRSWCTARQGTSSRLACRALYVPRRVSKSLGRSERSRYCRQSGEDTR